jgi:hypothetical protein
MFEPRSISIPAVNFLTFSPQTFFLSSFQHAVFTEMCECRAFRFMAQTKPTEWISRQQLSIQTHFFRNTPAAQAPPFIGAR